MKIAHTKDISTKARTVTLRFTAMFKLWPLTRESTNRTVIVFVWSRNSANWTKALVKGLLVPELNIVGGAAC